MLVICSIRGRNWGFAFQSVIIMKTGEKFHVEKENYDRLWQSFTERLEEGKNGAQAYPASTKQGKESLTPWYKKEGKKKDILQLQQQIYVPVASNSCVQSKISN